MTLTDEEAFQVCCYLRRVQPRGQADADQLDRIYRKLSNGDPA